MSAYKLLKEGGVKRLQDGANIPPVLDNLDWKIYKEWEMAGNVPDPLDVPTAGETAEATRLAELDAQITGSATLTSLKAMTNAQFDTWWTANVTNLAQANVVLKLIARVVLRRLL